MSALDRIHRFNIGLVKIVTLANTVFDQVLSIVIGCLLIWTAWWVPHHYALQLHSWARALPYGVVAIGAYCVWEGVAIIVAITRQSPSPPPTTRDTW